MTEAERALVTTWLSLCGACIVCLGLAELTPVGTWPWEGIGAVLRSAPPWLMATTPVFACWVAWRHRVVTGPLALSVLGLCCTGNPGLGRSPSGETLRLVGTNPQAYSDDSPEFVAALAALGADVLVQVEWRTREVPGLLRIADNYDDLPKPSLGMGVYCREGLGCRGTVLPRLGSESCAMPLALVAVKGMCVVGVHAPPPVPYSSCMQGRERYVARLEHRVRDGRLPEDWGPCAAGQPVVLVGDLNAVAGSAAVERLVATGLVDAQAGSGLWGSTWPEGDGWRTSGTSESTTYSRALHWVISKMRPVMRLDHLLVGPGVAVSPVSRVSLPQADHRALVVEVRP